MLNDITVGQYYPTGSPIHKLDPRTKIIFTLVYIIMLFVVNNLWGYIAAALMLTAFIIVSKIPFSYIIRGVKAILLIILLTVVLNLFMTPGEPIFTIGPLSIAREGIRVAVFMAVRLILLIVGTSLMTLTTSPIDLTDGMEHLLKYIPLVRHYAHELSMMMSIALRFIPTLVEETDRIMNAQKARGADFETGNIIKRAKALIPILVPLFISAFRRADELAVAMEARCYQGGKGRTRMSELHYSFEDKIAYVVMLVMILGLTATRFIAIPLGIF